MEEKDSLISLPKYSLASILELGNIKNLNVGIINDFI
jgi:hypothetical protein